MFIFGYKNTPMVDISLRQTQANPLTAEQMDDNFIALKTAIENIPSPSGGSVTSVAVNVPSFLTRTGSPITSSGTIEIALASQNANLIFASPASGSAATPTFRAIVANDLPTIPLAKLATTTASRAVVTDGSGNIGVSANITTTELDFLDGVTSNIQTQLNNKQATISLLPIANGGTNANTAAGARTNLLPSYASNANKFLRLNGGATDVEWITAVSSLNSLSGAVTIAAGSGATGNDVNISVAGSTITVNVPAASNTVSGKVNISAQTFKGLKTFTDGISLPTIPTGNIPYSDSGTLISNSLYKIDDAKLQAEFNRISVTERQVALGFNETPHTADYTVNNGTDYIIYMDTTSGSLDVNLPDTLDVSTEVGTIFRIVKTVAANNLTIKTTGTDVIDTAGNTSEAITATRGFIELQITESGLYRTIATGVIS
jgi:hypothetical protein